MLEPEPLETAGEGLTNAEILGTITSNYFKYHDLAERHKRLQSWASEVTK